MSEGDEIEIRRLAVMTHIGVPDEERAEPQTLWLSIRMRPSQAFLGLNDDVANTVDYYEASRRLIALAAEKPRHLIETLATEIADFLLSNYPLSSVAVEVEKRILSDAEYVSVRIRRRRVTAP
jgi:FolB domain-containing protein